MSLSKSDQENIIDRYSKRYNEYGYSPKSLGWDKGKQDIRFDILTSHYNFFNKHVLDIGCGFGDLNKTLKIKAKRYYYTGIDLVEPLLKEAKIHYPGRHINFIHADVLDFKTDIKYDFSISSGVFNHKLIAGNNYQFIEAVIKKTLAISVDGLAFDFLSDKVDYELKHTFHSSPEKILSIAYQYSRNVIIRNDYMPFEFSVFIFKDDSFDKNTTTFNRYKGTTL